MGERITNYIGEGEGAPEFSIKKRQTTAHINIDHSMDVPEKCSFLELLLKH